MVFNPPMAALLLMACASAGADLCTSTDEAGVLRLSDSPIDARYRSPLIKPPALP